MQYLVDRYDPQHKLSYPPGSREAVEVASWLFFQNAGVGPMQGQANHFSRYAPEKIQYGIDRYRNETKRLYSTLDKHLAEKGTEYIVGDRCTIADIAHVGWAASADYAGVELGEFKALSAWLERMLKRPGVVRGRDVPEKQEPGLSAEERKRRADEQAKEGLKWIQQGMKDDAAKK